MTTGENSEVWCRSKKPLNMTALAGTEKIISVSCIPQLLYFQMLYTSGGGSPYLHALPALMSADKQPLNVILLCC
jgi:hypothetical protein